ncbi:hypothetical protein [Thermococcus sp. 21S9]|uniref:hypothetical protein n=1 Tax=Thermococcus sp. 21S9 TaxID=1638223 RepID=UPI001F0E0493|nr:hypothetical protein [Thermococcus sp. 21S9]
MRKLLVLFAFFSLLLFLSYFYLPSENMSELYQKIPEQVRGNSELIAAYYSSQTGFDGFREYQFAFYNPKERTISIYTFKISKLLKIWPRMKKTTITCKTQLNYSVLATSPEKLKNFENCDNCRVLLYKGRIYKNEEIEGIYPSIDDVIKDKENTTYLELAVLKDAEISMGALEILSGDTVRYSAPSEYLGFIHLPSTMEDPKRGIVLELTPLGNQTARRTIHYPGGIVLTDTIGFKFFSNETWTLKEVPWNYTTKKLESEILKKEMKESLRFNLAIFKYNGKLEVFSDWINAKRKIQMYWRIYPPGEIEKMYYHSILGYYCG